jgi:hypothetical protein
METEIKLCECGCGEPAPLATQNHYALGLMKGDPFHFVRGHNARGRASHNKKHGMCMSREYRSFMAAKNRCTNQRDGHWKDYGGRGIKFLFTSFEQFFAYMGPRPEGTSLDRWPDNDGNYEPGNVRWANASEQNKNQRMTASRLEACRSNFAKGRAAQGMLR